jgi:hypothetical protein
MEPAAGSRRIELDWMRIALVLAAFLLTCARALGLSWQAEPSPGASWALEGPDLWLSPLFVLVSAGSAWHALERQGPVTFVVAKVLRLFVPLVVCALALSVGSTAGTLASSPSGEPPGAYLWYLPALLVFSLLWLPLQLALRRAGGARFSARLAAILSAPGALFLAGAVPAAAAALPRLLGLPGPFGPPGLFGPTGGALFGGWGIGFHFAVFSLSLLVFSGQGPQETIVRQRGWFVLAGAFFVGVAWLGRFVLAVPEAGLAAARAMAAWSLSLGFLGAGIAGLASYRPVPVFWSEAALPFYLLGLPAARFISRLLTGFPALGVLTFPVLVIASLATVTAAYAVVRRVTLLRFLFGLSPSAALTGGADRTLHKGGSQ